MRPSCFGWVGQNISVSCVETANTSVCPGQKPEAIDWAGAMATLEIDRTVKEVR